VGTAEPTHASQMAQLLVVYVPHDFDHHVTHDLEQLVTALMHQVCCRSAKEFVSVSLHKCDSSLLAVRHHTHCWIVSQSTTKGCVVAWLYAMSTLRFPLSPPLDVSVLQSALVGIVCNSLFTYHTCVTQACLQHRAS